MALHTCQCQGQRRECEGGTYLFVPTRYRSIYTDQHIYMLHVVLCFIFGWRVLDQQANGSRRSVAR